MDELVRVISEKLVVMTILSVLITGIFGFLFFLAESRYPSSLFHRLLFLGTGILFFCLYFLPYLGGIVLLNNFAELPATHFAMHSVILIFLALPTCFSILACILPRTKNLAYFLYALLASIIFPLLPIALLLAKKKNLPWKYSLLMVFGSLIIVQIVAALIIVFYLTNAAEAEDQSAQESSQIYEGILQEEAVLQENMEGFVLLYTMKVQRNESLQSITVRLSGSGASEADVTTGTGEDRSTTFTFPYEEMLNLVKYFTSEEFKSLEETYCSGRDRCQNETALYTLHVELPDFEKNIMWGQSDSSAQGFDWIVSRMTRHFPDGFEYW